MMSKILTIAPAIAVLTFMNIGGAYAQDAAAGQKVFRKCLSCHTLEPGKHKSGPSLHGIVGSTAGTKEGFKRYSSPLKAAGAAGLVWDEELLAAYLPDPNKFIAKYNSENNVKAKGRSRMSFKLPNEQERKDVIAYIASRSK